MWSGGRFGAGSRSLVSVRAFAALCCVFAWGLMVGAPAASAKKAEGPKPTNIAGSWFISGHIPREDRGGEGEEEDEEEANTANFSLFFFDKQHVGGGFGGETFTFSPDGEIGHVQGTISGSSVSFGVVFAPVTDEEFVTTIHFNGSVSPNGETMTGSLEYELESNNCRSAKLQLLTEENGESCEIKIFHEPTGTFKAERLTRAATEEEEIEKKEAKEEKEAEEDPTVTSLLDTTTGSKVGAFIGGDNLKITGTGFEAPEGEEVEVLFSNFGFDAETVDVTPTSDTEINVKVPELTFFEPRAPGGGGTLPFDVRVRYREEDDEGEELELISAQTPEAVYEAQLPYVASVTSSETQTNQGSISGGETLTIKGDGFIVPPGGAAHVSFEHEGEELGEPIEVTPTDTEEIQVQTPSLAKYARLIGSGGDGLQTDVIVWITGPEIEVSEENLGSFEEESRAQPDDVYEALDLDVSSVTDEKTNSDKGSIFGGDTLKIDGSGFSVPEGGTATVLFELGKEILAEEEVTPDSPHEIHVSSPDLAKDQDELQGGGLPLDVIVKISDGTDEVQSPADHEERGGETGDLFEAYPPQIQSVKDEQHGGTNKGSILGGETLDVKGIGFEAPEAGKTRVRFYVKGTLVEEREVDPVSNNDIEVESPDFAAYQQDIDLTTGAVPVEVIVLVSDGEHEVESSPKASDRFEAYPPQVSSVKDEQHQETNKGSILGGDKLHIKGVGFESPVDGKTKVRFYIGSTLVEEREVDPLDSSNSEIEVESPDLAAYQDRIDEATDAVPVEVIVVVSDGKHEVLSLPTAGDLFEAYPPRVQSVTDEETGTSSGSILGGDTLKVKGVGFGAPDGGRTEVRFDVEGELVEEREVDPVSDTEIEAELPDLRAYRSKASKATGGIPVEVTVVVSDGAANVLSLPNTGSLFEAFAPNVTSVTDEETGNSTGSILGGDTVHIEGTGFVVPTGGKAVVAFDLGPDDLKNVVVTPISSTEIEVESPDLTAFINKIPAKKLGLPLNLVVAIANSHGENAESLNNETGAGPEAFEALIPQVTSVTDEETTSNNGSILGGDTLKIEGTGFNVPTGGKAVVAFDLGPDDLRNVVVTPLSSTEIELTSPNLVSFVSKLPAGKHGLPLNLVVAIANASHETAESANSENGTGPDGFEALVPQVSSVLDEETDSNSGSILGGDTLHIDGSGFNVPEGGPGVTVAFYHDGAKLGEAVHVPEGTFTPSEIEVPAPNLASDADLVALGADALPVEVVVTAGTLSESVSSPENGSGDIYEALVPKIDSVTNATAGAEQSGSILGGESLTITGSGFDLPPLDSSAKVVFEDEEGTLGEVKATPISSTEIELTSPDLAKYASEIPAGKDGLAADLAVVIEADGAGVQSAAGEAGGAYAAELPEVESVLDESTGKAAGSALGGDSVVVKGAWLQAPKGGSTEIEFRDAEGPAHVSTEEGTPIDGNELLVTAPNLSAEAAQDELNEVPTDLVAKISDGTNAVSSPVLGEGDPGSDTFLAEGPYVSSVENADTGTHSGSIDGGQTLTIEGTGFLVSPGDTATVEFLDPKTDEQLAEVAATALTAETIQISSPDLSSFAPKSGDGKLTSEVRVKITDLEDEETESPVSSGDRFSFEPLAITSAGAADFKVGHDEDFSITAQGGSAIELEESGALPEGVSFTDDGEGSASIHGTPDARTAGTYDLRITASDGAGAEVTQDFTLTVKDVPGAPREVAASAGVDSAKVLWSAPSSDGNSPIETYTVTASPGGASTTVDGSESSAVIEGLTAGTPYTFSVLATNALGEGPASQSSEVVPTSSQLEDGHSATSESPGGTATPEPVTSPSGETLTATGEGSGTVEIGTYAHNPVLTLSDGTSFFDVQTTPSSGFNTVSFKICGLTAGATVDWFDADTGKWLPASDQSAPGGSPLCITVTVNSSSSPSLADLDGTVFAVVAPAPCSAAPTVEGQPANVTVKPGATATFTASASIPAGCATPSVQWYSKAPGEASFSAVVAATSTSYTTPPTTLAQSGTLFEAIFKNASGAQTTQQATLTVNGKVAKGLGLTPASLRSETATHPYRVTLTASNGSGDYHFRETGTLPNGLSWDTEDEAAGTITLVGTPATAGTTTIVVEAADSSVPAHTVRREYTLTVQLALSGSVGKATADERYSRQILAAGGTAPYRFKLSSGSLPGGISLGEHGLLSGTPTAAGTSRFTVTVSDSSEPALQRTISYSLIVRLAIEPSKLPAGSINTPYGPAGHGVQITARGGNGSYEVNATGLPKGLRLMNGLLMGTPEEEGTYPITIHVTDGATPAHTANAKYMLKIGKQRH
jgi:hypothetical protein